MSSRVVVRSSWTQHQHLRPLLAVGESGISFGNGSLDNTPSAAQNDSPFAAQWIQLFTVLTVQAFLFDMCGQPCSTIDGSVSWSHAS